MDICDSTLFYVFGVLCSCYSVFVDEGDVFVCCVAVGILKSLTTSTNTPFVFILFSSCCVVLSCVCIVGVH